MEKFIVEDKESYLKCIKNECLEMEKFGSMIFPMKGNELFEETKMNLKKKLKQAKKIIKAIEAGESRVVIDD